MPRDHPVTALVSGHLVSVSRTGPAPDGVGIVDLREAGASWGVRVHRGWVEVASLGSRVDERP